MTPDYASAALLVALLLTVIALAITVRAVWGWIVEERQHRHRREQRRIGRKAARELEEQRVIDGMTQLIAMPPADDLANPTAPEPVVTGLGHQVTALYPVAPQRTGDPLRPVIAPPLPAGAPAGGRHRAEDRPTWSVAALTQPTGLIDLRFATIVVSETGTVPERGPAERDLPGRGITPAMVRRYMPATTAALTWEQPTVDEVEA